MLLRHIIVRLHYTFAARQIRIVEALFENGAEVNAVDDKKWTALLTMQLISDIVTLRNC